MCNLYSVTKGQAAIRDLFTVTHDRAGNLPSLPAIFPDQMAAIAFCEYADTKPRRTPIWFALAEDRPLFAFAGVWTPWHGVRGPKSAPVEGEHELFGFLTTECHGDLKSSLSRFASARRLRSGLRFRLGLLFSPRNRQQQFPLT